MQRSAYTNHREYLNSLGINAGAIISGYGQSASLSGAYLDKGKVMIILGPRKDDAHTYSSCLTTA